MFSFTSEQKDISIVILNHYKVDAENVTKHNKIF